VREECNKPDLLGHLIETVTAQSKHDWNTSDVQGFPTPVTGLVVRQAGYWSGSLPPGRKTDRQAEKTDRHAEK
jgi:hypothetical protein